MPLTPKWVCETVCRFNHKTAQIAFHLGAFYSAWEGGKTTEDAVDMATEYYHGHCGCTEFDPQSGAGRKAVSCVRKCLELGEEFEGVHKLLDTIEDLFTRQNKLFQQGEPVHDLTNTFLNFARVQVRERKVITNVRRLNRLVRKES